MDNIEKERNLREIESNYSSYYYSNTNQLSSKDQASNNKSIKNHSKQSNEFDSNQMSQPKKEIMVFRKNKFDDSYFNSQFQSFHHSDQLFLKSQEYTFVRFEEMGDLTEEDYKFVQGEKYYRKELIGQGGEAEIFEGYYLNENKERKYIVIKQLKPDNIKQEVDILKLFKNNQMVVQLEDSIHNSNGVFALILEKCKYSLEHELDQLQKAQQEFSFAKLVEIILSLLDGLIQFRIHNIVHLDIKPANILITQLGQYVYSDFGLSINLKNSNRTNIVNGCSQFFAPEEQILGTKKIGYKSDVYSLGVTFQEIINIYKRIMGSKQTLEQQIVIEEFENIIRTNMTLFEISQIPNREDCEVLHQMFLELIPKDTEYLVHYLSKIRDIINHDYKDNHIDIPYYQEIKLYYLRVVDEIENQISKNKKADYYYRIGQQYYQLGDYDQALMYTNLSLNLKRSIFPENHIEIAQGLELLGNCHFEMNDYILALECGLKCNEILNCCKEKDQMVIALSLNNIKRYYKGENDIQSSYRYLNESISIFSKLLQESNIIFDLPKDEQQEFTEENYRLLSLIQFQMMEKLSINNSQSISDLLTDIGSLYTENKEFNTALYYYNHSFEIKEKIYKESHPKIKEINQLISHKQISNFSFQKLKFVNKNKLFQKNITLFSRHLAPDTSCVGSEERNLKFFKK